MALRMVALPGSGWRDSHRFTGLAAGPPMILACMSGPCGAARVRATALLFFLLMEVPIVITFHMQGMLAPEALVLCVSLITPFVVGTLVGARIFDPAHARLYRFVAYGLIALSAMTALPING